MALTAPLQATFDLTQNATFQQRITVAAINQVSVVASETTGTADHANRLAFAAQVAYSPQPWAQRMALGCVVASTNIQSAILGSNTPAQNNAAVADADIVNVVALVWNFYADAAVALTGATGNKVV